MTVTEYEVLRDELHEEIRDLIRDAFNDPDVPDFEALNFMLNSCFVPISFEEAALG